MKEQDSTNYRRYYYPHHFIFYPVCLILIVISIMKYTDNTELKYVYALFAATISLIAWLSFMMRQHYAMTSQNRIIRLELRLRYYQITGQSFEEIEEKLSFAQLAALRFASDEEFVALTHRTLVDGISAENIKKAITGWRPDHMRV